MAKKSILAQVDEAPEINLSPMIDCIFILLIFFIVTTVFVEETGVQIHKPDISADPPPPSDEENENIVLQISAENKVLFNGEDVGVKGVGSRVKQRLSRPDLPISIKAHEKSDHGVFIAVWDVVKMAGATHVTFTTEN